MTTTLEKVRKLTAGLREREQEEAAELIAQYRQLVRDVTDGKALDPETVIAQLYECGKTAEELEADCVHLTTRQEMFSRLKAARQIVDALPALRAEQARNLEEADAEYKAYKAKWTSRDEDIRVKMQAANQADTQVIILVEQLLKTAWPEHIERLADVARRRVPILREWQELRGEIDTGHGTPARYQRLEELSRQMDLLSQEDAVIRAEMERP